MSITDQAICLRRSDYSETSLVLRLMTRQHGQVSLIAKGIKRPSSRLGGPIDLLSVGQAVFILPRERSASTMGTLTAWSQTAWHSRLRTDLLRHATAMLAGELLARLTADLDPHPASFDAMTGLLDALQAEQPPLRRLAEFARTVLADVGLSPGLERCARCGRLRGTSGPPPSPAGPEPAGPPPAGSPAADRGSPGRPSGGGLRFSGPRGGVLCPACSGAPGESHVRISRQLQEFFILARPASGKLALEIARWLVYYVQHQIGRPLTSAAALERAIAAALAAKPSAGGSAGPAANGGISP